MTKSKDLAKTALTESTGISVPLICGAMYPCSNPELVAAVSAAGGMGIVQPISLTYVHGHDMREGIRKIVKSTPHGVGFNALVEASNRVYLDRMKKWVDIALEEGVRFFVTALGNPGWVVDRVHAVGGLVYHDVTELKWAERALKENVDGLICVNKNAGGHAGTRAAEALYKDLEPLKVPLVCAGGIGSPEQFREALNIGYAGVQLGTRFIASTECKAHDDYKQAIVKAKADDIVLTEKISGVPVAVINTPYLEKVGTKAGPISRRLLRHPKGKHLMRTLYTLKSIFELKRASLKGNSYRDYWQAGRSVEKIHKIESAGDIVREFKKALDN